MGSFCVVEFAKLKEMSIIPSKWIIDNAKCWWPPYKSSLRQTKAAMGEEPVDHATWTTHEMRILKSYSTYAAASANAELALYTSDLPSESEGKMAEGQKTRKRRKRKASSSDSDLGESDDSTIRPPTIPISNSQSYFTLAVGSGTHSSSTLDASSISPLNAGKSPMVETATPGRAETYLHSVEFDTPRSSAQGRDARFQQHVVKALAQIQQQQKIHSEILNQLCNVERRTSIGVAARPNYQLPLQTVAQFDDLELKLEEESCYSELVSFLKSIGGKDYKDTLSRAFEAVFTNELAQQFCWMGIRKVNSKRPFQNSKLKSVLYDAVRLNPLSSTATDSELKMKAASWLQHAGDRIKPMAQQ